MSTLDAGGSIGATIATDATWGTMTAVTGIDVTAGNSVTGTLARTTGSGAAIAIDAPGGITIDTVDSNGTTELIAAEGAIDIGALSSARTVRAEADSVTIAGGDGRLDFTSLVADNGDASVTSGDGDLIVRNGSATGDLTLLANGGNLEGRALSARSITLGSSETTLVSGNATAADALSIESGGATMVTGVATGRTVDIISGDIVVGATGRIGTGGTTTLLHLTNGNGGTRTFVGGGDTAQGYSLSAAEMQRIYGNNITITAPRAATQGGATVGSTRPPDLVIDAFSVAGGSSPTGNLGANGTLQFQTPGFARVIGAGVLTGATAANTLAVQANQELQVILGTGSLSVLNNGAPAGTLSLSSNDIVVATSAAISDIAGLTSTSAIDDRLARNDGVLREDGALIGGTIRFSALNNLLVQNSGSSDAYNDRRGFTAGSGGVAILIGGTGGTTGPSSGSGRIVINGRVSSTLGSYLVGRDAFTAISINDHTLSSMLPNAVNGFDAASTINGCGIIAPGLCVELAVNFDIQNNPLVDQEDEESRIVEEGEGDPYRAIISIDLRDPDPLPNEPLIDEPVTGSGNDDLWLSTDCAAPSSTGPTAAADPARPGAC